MKPVGQFIVLFEVLQGTLLTVAGLRSALLGTSSVLRGDVTEETAARNIGTSVPGHAASYIKRK